MGNLLQVMQFSGASLKGDENPPSVSTVMLWSSVHLRPEEDRSIMVETSAGYSSTFKLVPENCISYMLQPAEKTHFDSSVAFNTDSCGPCRGHCVVRSRNCNDTSFQSI